MATRQKSKMISVEFYFLLDDYTWNTNFIDIPKSLVDQFNQTHIPHTIVNWVYNNVKLHKDVAIVGLYSVPNEEEV